MPERTSLTELTDEPHAGLFETDRPRVVRLALDAGQEVPPHTHPRFDVVLHIVAGELTVVIDGEPFDCTAGDVVRFDGRKEVSPRAETDATALVVFAPRPGTETGAT